MFSETSGMARRGHLSAPYASGVPENRSPAADAAFYVGRARICWGVIWQQCHARYGE